MRRIVITTIVSYFGVIPIPFSASLISIICSLTLVVDDNSPHPAFMLFWELGRTSTRSKIICYVSISFVLSLVLSNYQLFKDIWNQIRRFFSGFLRSFSIDAGLCQHDKHLLFVDITSKWLWSDSVLTSFFFATCYVLTNSWIVWGLFLTAFQFLCSVCVQARYRGNLSLCRTDSVFEFFFSVFSHISYYIWRFTRYVFPRVCISCSVNALIYDYDHYFFN